MSTHVHRSITAPMMSLTPPREPLKLSSGWLASVVGVFVVCAAAIAAFSGVLPLPFPLPFGHRPEPAASRVGMAVPQVGDQARAVGVQASAVGMQVSPPCADCGVVLMIRTFELQPEGFATEPPAIVSDSTSVSGVTQDGVTKSSSSTLYRVTVRMDDGSFRTLSQSLPPTWSPGDPVRLAKGSWVKR